MSLTAAAKVATNQETRARAAAAIRNTASAKYEADGKPGQLAKVALLDPSIVLDHIMVRLAADPTITEGACPECGSVWQTKDGTIDAAISYVVNTQWDGIAEIVLQVPGV